MDVKTTFDYGALENVAKATFNLMVAHLETDRLEYEAGWNKSRVLREAVESVAGY
jgi:hypothetical protein